MLELGNCCVEIGFGRRGILLGGEKMCTLVSVCMLGVDALIIRGWDLIRVVGVAWGEDSIA